MVATNVEKMHILSTQCVLTPLQIMLTSIVQLWMKIKFQLQEMKMLLASEIIAFLHQNEAISHFKFFTREAYIHVHIFFKHFLYELKTFH